MFSVIAYLDPGTGSIIVQSIIAGFVGLLVAIKLFWKRIIGFFRFRNPPAPDANSTPKRDTE